MSAAAWILALALAAAAPQPEHLGPPPTPAPAAMIDINSASVEELCTLPGIGPKKAEGILKARAHRPFARVTQLLQVKGIGRRTLERLKPRIVVGPAAKPR